MPENYYLISLGIVLFAMLLMLLVFEGRRPRAREIVVVAVLTAVAVIGRAAFFMLPFFKPTAAVVILAGIGFGAQTGFLTGALSAFVSNFFFGQGPWTPWQMFALGVIGFLAGLIFHGNRYKSSGNRWTIALYGGIATCFGYGIMMDSASVLMYTADLQWKAFLAMYISGLPVNAVHGFSTVFFLLLLAKPMITKMERVKMKYGMLVR